MTGAAAWTDAVRALALFAADPLGLVGIAIRSSAGPVRDHYLKLLRDALPPEMRMHRLPAHIGDDRLLGGLDLAETLRAGRPVMQKGLLAEADGGLVVLTMAERIAAEAAAKVRAALDDGSVALQREGLSGVLPTRFAIVALDEGVEPDERPPASLLDRLALHVDLTEVSVRDSGASIHVDASRACGVTDEAPPARFNQDDQTIDLVNAVETLCQVAMALGIDSPRAPLFALRAARVAAASDGRTHVTDADVCLAARLVLAPRATRVPATESAEETADAEPESSEPDDGPDNPSADQPLADVVLDAAKAALPPDLLARLALADAGRGLARGAGRAGQFKSSNKRGRPIGTRQGDVKGGARLNLLETLKAAAPWQAVRGRCSGRLEVRRDDLRVVRFRQRIGTTTMFAVDASGSSAMNRLNEAKGAVELLLADCYVRRDQVAVLAFRGQGATVLLPPTGSLLRAKRSLAGLPGGGPTPLAAGIDAAMTLAGTIRRGGRTPVIILLTDARANIARDGTGGRPRAEAEAMQIARSVHACGIAALLVDTSPRPNPFARQLAHEMRAQYLPLPYADAAALSRAARAAQGQTSGGMRD